MAECERRETDMAPYGGPKFYESPNPSKLLGENALRKCLPICKNVLRDYDLEHKVTVWSGMGFWWTGQARTQVASEARKPGSSPSGRVPSW